MKRSWRRRDGDRFSGLLAPLFRSVNTDVNTPLAIAIFSFVFVEYWGFSTLGAGYLKKFFNFGRLLRGNPMGLIDVFVGLLELISEFARLVSFTFRLFGNIFAGEVLLLMMAFLVPFLLVDIFYGLELFVGLGAGLRLRDADADLCADGRGASRRRARAGAASACAGAGLGICVKMREDAQSWLTASGRPRRPGSTGEATIA